MIEFMKDICVTLGGLIVLKAIIIGSDFSFALWLKHGKEYMNWYDKRNKAEFTPKP